MTEIKTSDWKSRGPRAEIARERRERAVADASREALELGRETPETYRYGRRQRLYRGAPPDMDRPFIACIGGERTFGRGAESPWPERLGEALDMPVFNLGAEGAGPGFFLADSGVLEACSRASHVVVELCGAWNLSNRYYTVGRRYNRRLRGVSDLMRELFPEVRLEEFEFVGKLMEHLHALDPARFTIVETECKAAWTARMRAVLEALETPATLLWFGHRLPEEEIPIDVGKARGLPPEAVDRQMIEAILPGAAAYVELVFARPDDKRPKAAPTDAMHDRIAAELGKALSPALRR